MNISDKCLEMLKHHEGVRYRPYQCPALLWTVGVGHVIDQSHIKIPVQERRALPIPDGWDRTLSADEVDALLKQDLHRFEAGVLRLCPVNLNQSRFDALVSFSFNVGCGNLQASTLRMRHNRGDIQGAADAFLMWTRGGGRVLPGLVRRRKDERERYLSEPEVD